MTSPTATRKFEEHLLEQLTPEGIGSLVTSIEYILPALRELADGGEPRVVTCESIYEEPAPSWLEAEEGKFCVRMVTERPRFGDEYLSIEELGEVAKHLTLLYDHWSQSAGPDPVVRGQNGTMDGGMPLV